MSENKDLIQKLKILIEQRQKTIQANKKQMRDNLKEYKKNLELDGKLKSECRTLRETIYELLRSMANTSESKNVLKNIASNRHPDIVIGDEESDS
jgi:CRISPR/Cas system-associated endonuclease Cas3-HD